MNKFNLIFIILFLLRLKNSSCKYYILFSYYLILVYGLFFKGNMINNKKSPKNINNLWIQYYYYDTLYYLYFFFYTNSRRYSIGKIVHHLITLNFFLRKRYNSRALNLIHGNIILSTVPGHIVSMINKTRFAIKGNAENRLIDIYTQAFTFFYLNLFFLLNTYLIYKYNTDKKIRKNITKNVKNERFRMDFWYIVIMCYSFYIGFKLNPYITSMNFSLICWYFILLKKKNKLKKFYIKKF